MTFGPDIPFWEAIGFQDRLQAWIERESPDDDLLRSVGEWIERQTLVDPFRGVRRYTEIAANFWWGRIPGTVRGTTAVFGFYWIDEDLRQIRCDSIATLNEPVF